MRKNETLSARRFWEEGEVDHHQIERLSLFVVEAIKETLYETGLAQDFWKGEDEEDVRPLYTFEVHLNLEFFKETISTIKAQ